MKKIVVLSALSFLFISLLLIAHEKGVKIRGVKINGTLAKNSDSVIVQTEGY